MIHWNCTKISDTNLRIYTDYILEHKNEGSQVDAIYKDFSTACDKTDHVSLLKKLTAAGIHGD